MLRRLILILLVALAPGAAVAVDYRSGSLRVTDPWGRASAGPTSAAYLVILNDGGTADRLIGATSPAAERVEMHVHLMEGDVMRMRQIEAVDLPAGAITRFAPGGHHLMLLGLTAPLQEGAAIPLTLVFEGAGTLTITVPIGKMGAAGPATGG